MNLILNLSPKKSGTSTIFELFRKNFPNEDQKEIFNPSHKEYYTFPRNSKNFLNFYKNISAKYTELESELTDSEKFFFQNLLEQSSKETLSQMSLAAREKNYVALTELCLQRMKKIFTGIKHKYCMYMDNNFFEDLIGIFPQNLHGNFFKIF